VPATSTYRSFVLLWCNPSGPCGALTLLLATSRGLLWRATPCDGGPAWRRCGRVVLGQTDERVRTRVGLRNGTAGHERKGLIGLGSTRRSARRPPQRGGNKGRKTGWGAAHSAARRSPSVCNRVLTHKTRVHARTKHGTNRTVCGGCGGRGPTAGIPTTRGTRRLAAACPGSTRVVLRRKKYMRRRATGRAAVTEGSAPA